MADTLNYRKSFLLAEDDEDFLMIMKLALEDTGFAGRLDLVRDYRSLLGYLQQKEEPRLIILDLKNKPEDWRTALRGLKTHHLYKSIPVVVLTASDDQEDIDLCKRYRRCSIIQKPSTFTDWRTCMKNLVRTRLPDKPESGRNIDLGP
ncbi:MAG: response regulator [Desulfobacteraceae bacterium]|nr:MAG: response regulator [Desulfobacteraceae bacterium]